MKLRFTCWIGLVTFCSSVCANGEPKQPWLDELHLSVSDGVQATAQWFDNFFVNEYVAEPEQAAAEARIMLGWEPRSRDWSELVSRFRVRVKLPNAKNQVDVILSDYDEEGSTSPRLVRHQNLLDQPERFNLALRWTQKHSEASDVSHRLGIGRQLQLYWKSSIRQMLEVNPSSNVNVSADVYFYSQDGLGSHFMLQYELAWREKHLFRLDNHYYYRDNSNDWLWQHGVYNFHQLDAKQALITGLYVEGLSRPNYRVEEYMLSARWRRNAIREWLFFEVEPFVLWPREESFRASYGLALRVEGYFSRD